MAPLPRVIDGGCGHDGRWDDGRWPCWQPPRPGGQVAASGRCPHPKQGVLSPPLRVGTGSENRAPAAGSRREGRGGVRRWGGRGRPPGGDSRGGSEGLSGYGCPRRSQGRLLPRSPATFSNLPWGCHRAGSWVSTPRGVVSGPGATPLQPGRDPDKKRGGRRMHTKKYGFVRGTTQHQQLCTLASSKRSGRPSPVSTDTCRAGSVSAAGGRARNGAAKGRGRATTPLPSAPPPSTGAFTSPPSCWPCRRGPSSHRSWGPVPPPLPPAPGRPSDRAPCAH